MKKGRSPGFPVRRFEEPAAGLRYIFVVAAVGSAPRTCDLDPGRGLAGGGDGDGFQLRAADIPDDPSFETVPLVGAVEVHTAAQNGFVSGVDEVMDEGGYVGLEAAGIGPDADVRAVAARQERHPRRHAEGIGAVIGGKANPAGGKLVERRGAHHVVPGTPEDVRAVLIRHDQQDVRTVCHLNASLYQPAPAALGLVRDHAGGGDACASGDGCQGASSNV